MLSNDDIAQFFTDAQVNIQGNRSLRDPQREGHAAAGEYFNGGGHRAVEQIPVGCGKTGLISILPFGIARGRVLVIAPNLTIRDQIADAVDVTNVDGFYRSSGVLTDLSAGPYRAVLDRDANLGDCDEAHIVVTNIHHQVAAELKLPPNQAPTTTQFTDTSRKLGLDWTVSKVGRIFKGWANAQSFYERRQLPETARQVRQRRYLRDSGRTLLDHLAKVAEWLDGKPPDTGRKAYDEWRSNYSRSHAGSDRTLPAHSRYLLRLFPELTWQDIIDSARDAQADPWALSRERAEQRLREESNPLGLVAVSTAAALLGLTVARFEYALKHLGHEGFPQVYGWVGMYAVFRADDVVAYRDTGRAPRRAATKQLRLWTGKDVAERIGMRAPVFYDVFAQRDWSRIPAPTGGIAGAHYWDPKKVESWCRKHPDAC